MMNFEKIALCPVFRGVPEKELKGLIQSIHFQIKSFKKDEIVAIAGDPVTKLHIILEGSVKGEMMDYSGKTIKIEDVEAPKPLAAAFLFGKDNKFPVTVTTNSSVQLLSVPVPEFLKLLQKNSQILKNYLNSISTRAQFLSQKLHFLNFKTIKEKMAHFLLHQAGKKLHSVELKMTQQQMADLFGVSRPSLARVLGGMQKEGLIQIDKKTIILTDKKQLNQLLQNG
ncbi:MAG: Crp/Fnr family transcriptional regulator [Prolixibacteraceae bacterium]